MQESFAGPGDATGFLAILFRMVVVQDGLDRLERGPADGGGVFGRDPPTPLLHGEALGGRAPRRTAGAQRARPALGKGARIRRVLQNGEDRGDGGAFPDDLPEAVAARYAQATGVEKLQHLAGRPPLHKRLKDQGNPGLPFQMRVFVYPAQGIAFETRRERQRQVASGRLVEEPRRHTRADGMEFPCGQGALQPKQ